jgi:hypothetical protein
MILNCFILNTEFPPCLFCDKLVSGCATNGVIRAGLS